jgi:UDP-N-acetylmuramyl pentapeptide phosphotransferase/UDP-N-acetylglucosamine-1-phosphate transferase
MQIAIIAFVAFAVAALSGHWLIPALRKLHFGQSILEIGPNWHKDKEGTPTMGGIMFVIGILAASALAFVFLADAPVTEKITIVINRITQEEFVSLDNIFTDCTSRSELVATFLAILELMKSQKITADFSDDPAMPKLRLITPDDITDNPISEGGLPE